jgi:hypothetical protein
VVGPVHPKNMKLLADAMPERHFRMIYEPGMCWTPGFAVDGLPPDALSFDRDQVPQRLSPNDFSAVVFSTVQPRPAPLNLLHWALRNNLPTFAIEEGNQLALNSGRYCNYLAPLDYLLVASSSEQEHLVSIGTDPERIHVTGWPFCSSSGAVSVAIRRASKFRLGLNGDAPVAALTLTAYADSGEVEQVRVEQLRMAQEGLGPEYQLVIKPHPIESMDVLRGFVNQHARRATIIDGGIAIDELLDATDVLLNRGVSQVAFEALLKVIPVVILDVGDRTPFHDSAPDCVAAHSAEVSEVVRRIEESEEAMSLYKGVFEQHIPYTPMQAKRETCAKISSAIKTHKVHLRGEQWLEFALVYAWQVDRRAALSVLTGADCGALGRSLSELIRRRASEQDLELLIEHWQGRYEEQILLCLLCEQLRKKKRDIQTFHLGMMRRLFSSVNPHLFCRHYELWGRVLLDRGHAEEFSLFREKMDSMQGQVYELEQTLDRLNRYSRGLVNRCTIRIRDGKNTAIRAFRRGRYILRDPLR